MRLVFTSIPVLPPKHWAYADYTGMLPHEETHSRPPEITVSLNFIDTEKVKQNDKTKVFLSIEGTRENP